MNEIYSLTSFRFLIAFYVFVFHCQIHVGPIFDWKIASEYEEIFNYIIGLGYIGMSMFFVLSGYILALNYNSFDKIEYKKYYLNRIARIYPSYIFVGLIGIFYFAISLENTQIYNINMDLKYLQYIFIIIMYLFMFQSFFPHTQYIGNFSGTWSLSVEALFYLFYPSIRNFLNISSTKFLIYLLIITYIWFSLPTIYLNLFVQNNIYEITNWYIYSSPIFRMGEFIFAIIFYILINERLKYNFLSINIVIILFLIIIFFIYAVKFNILKGFSTYNFLVVPLSLYIIYALHNTKSKVLSNRIFVYFGKISYGFYLAQFFVFSIYNNLIVKYMISFNILGKWFIIFICTLIISIFMYHFIEIPFRKRIREIL